MAYSFRTVRDDANMYAAIERIKKPRILPINLNKSCDCVTKIIDIKK